MPRNRLEAERVEYRLEDARFRGSELDELEAVEAHRVVEKLRHGCLLLGSVGVTKTVRVKGKFHK
jgi:hypothetical protein